MASNSVTNGKGRFPMVWLVAFALTAVLLRAYGVEPLFPPSLEQAIKSKLDVWGEAAMAQPNGANYEFIAPLMPPPRYVNADFHRIEPHPGILPTSAAKRFVRDNDPESKPKARLSLSNGSGLNLRAGASGWDEVGTPVKFRVGARHILFGSLADRVSEPTLAEGWMPIAERGCRYLHQACGSNRRAWCRWRQPVTTLRRKRFTDWRRLPATGIRSACCSSTDSAYC